jgi:hypothetical protein
MSLPVGIMGELESFNWESWRVSTGRVGEFQMGELESFNWESWRVSTGRVEEFQLGELESFNSPMMPAGNDMRV